MYKRKTENDDPSYIGKQFGRLTVIGFREVTASWGHGVAWDLRCECGNVIYGRRPSMVKSGEITSCGCVKAEQNIHNLAEKRRSHGKSRTRLYGIWLHMKNRCYLKSEPAYPNYGGRGIAVCNEWHDFQNFYDWAMANGYQENLTIERIDVNGNYYPDNCKWISLSEQTWNKRDTIRVTLGDEVVPLKVACERLGLPYKAVHLRITRYGMSIDEALTKPFKNH